MDSAITTIKGFINHMQPGMPFWTIHSNCGEPTRVEGPMIFIEYKDSSREIAIIEKNGVTDREYVDDLTNCWHGVCHTAKLAHQLFTIRKHQWENRTHEEIAEHNIKLQYKKNRVLSLR